MCNFSSRQRLFCVVAYTSFKIANSNRWLCLYDLHSEIRQATMVLESSQVGP